MSSRYRLEVIDGPNAGAGVRIERGGWSIGASADDDLSVLAATPDAGPARMRLERDALSPLLGLKAAVESGVVTIDGRQIAGARRLRRGAVAALGDDAGRHVVGVRFGGAPSDRLATARLRQARGAGPAAKAAIAGLAVAAATFVGSSATTLDAIGAYLGGISGEALDQTAAITRPQSVETPEAAGAAGVAARFTDEAARRGFAQRVAISVDAAARAATLTGRIDPSERAAWRAMRTWLDGAAPGLFVVDQVRVAARRVALTFRIVAMMSGDPGRVTLEDGRRFSVGEVLPGGWRLTATDGRSATLTRGQDTVRLSP